jgi:uncharacterized phage protein (TIGR02218 family)
MLADLASDTCTFNTCWLITRVDGNVYAWTDCDQPLTVGGHTYSPLEGYSPSANEGKSDFSVDNMEVVGFLDSPAITEIDVAQGKWDYAALDVFMVNRNAISHGNYYMRHGWLGQVKIQTPGVYTAEIRGLSQAVQNNLGDLITPTCRWTFCDANPSGSVLNSHCTLNVATFTTSGVAVTSVSSNQEWVASSLTQAAGYFAFGYLTWLTGNNAGVSADIQGHGSGGVILTQLPAIGNVQVGDTFNIVAGCQKRYAQDCVAKFSNGINFGGFPYLPGLDKIVKPAGY